MDVSRMAPLSHVLRLCSPATEAGHRCDVDYTAPPKSWDPRLVETQATHLYSQRSRKWDRRSRESKKRQDEAAAGEEEDQLVLQQDVQA